MRFALLLFLRQGVLVGLAVLAYFGVRGLTEGDVAAANRNAEWVLDAERFVGLGIELGIQRGILGHQSIVDLANWIYIWGHWPIVVATLVWLVFAHRDAFFELRNAIFISGAIGLVIFATFPVTPPRLIDARYIDTVTQHSESYRVLQPPALVNALAAVPSLHFGWNLLVALTWRRIGQRPLSSVAAVIMPAAMLFAVVATANHWVLDVLAGSVVALSGLALERGHRRYIQRRRSRRDQACDDAGQPDVIDPSDEKVPVVHSGTS